MHTYLGQDGRFIQQSSTEIRSATPAIKIESDPEHVMDRYLVRDYLYAG